MHLKYIDGMTLELNQNIDKQSSYYWDDRGCRELKYQVLRSRQPAAYKQRKCNASIRYTTTINVFTALNNIQQKCNGATIVCCTDRAECVDYFLVILKR